MKRVNITLKSQLTLLMTILVILQSIALISSIILSGTFIMLDAEAFRVMNSITLRRTQVCNDSIKSIVKAVSEETSFLNDSIEEYARNIKVPTSRLCDNDKLYKKASMLAGDSVIYLLNTIKITGAFVVFDKSNARKNSTDAHSCIYIRNPLPDDNKGNASHFSLEMGMLNIAKKYKINSSMNCTLDWKFDKGSSKYSFYNKPIEAANLYPHVRTEKYGYWNKPFDILNDGVEVVTYTVPLVDSDGNVYGVLGIEENTSYIAKSFLPPAELPYKNGFYLISDIKKDDLSLDWYMSSRIISKDYLSNTNTLKLKKIKKANLYSIDTYKMGKMYCSSYNLKMYGKNSVFSDDVWSLSGFAPEAQLRESSTVVRTALIISILATTLVSFLVILFIAKASTRKISGLSGYIKNLKPYQDINFKRTGTREIDELMNAVEIFNNNIINASQTVSHILDLTSLPIGAFKISPNFEHIIVTGYIQSLLDIEDVNNMSKDEWDGLYQELVSNVYDKENNIYEYYSKGECKIVFLRIIENEIDNEKMGVIIDVTKDIEDKKKLAYQVDHDALTRLYNRKAFLREVEKKIEKEPEFVGGMVFADLDNLKYTNDMFGHDVGDTLIKSAAKMFSNMARIGGVAARISGDEFALYVHGYDSKEELLAVIYEHMAKSEDYDFKTSKNITVKVRASLGIAWYPYDSTNVSELLKMADYAMYEVKHNEKGGIREFNTSSYKENSYLIKNTESLNKLLDEGLIRFAYQPIVDLKTGEIYGYEMLMRSMLDDFKSPKEILSVAEAQKKLGRLERLVLVKAFESIRKNLTKLDNVKLFINTIPSQVVSEEDLQFLTVNYSDLFLKVVIEIIETESNSPENLDNKIRYTRDNGMMLAIDDFGSGNSNELRILSIKPDIVKIDMGIVQGVHADEDKRAIISNLISFCKSKGTKIIAEGVETSEDLKAIFELGVDFVQGYYTGKPNIEIMDITGEKKAEIRELSGLL